MKKFKLFALVLFSCLSAFANSKSHCEIASDIVKTAQKFHYHPRSLDQKFSESVFVEFIDQLDPYASYLTNEDLAELEKFKFGLHESIPTHDCELLDLSSKILEKRINLIRQTIAKLQPADLLDLEGFLTYSNEAVYLSETDLIEKWKQIVRFRLLSNFYVQQKGEAWTEELFEDFIAKELSTTLDQFECQINEKYKAGEEIPSLVGLKYLHAIAKAFDPHTNYFSPEEENSFENSLSKNALSFGFNVSKNDEGKAEIVYLAPGGPAWRSNRLNEGDFLISYIADNGENRPTYCMSSTELNEMLDGTSPNTIKFHFQKQNGEDLSLTLTKEEIEVAENVIDSYLLRGNKKIGYIYLPSFYSSDRMSGYLSNGCANDIAKELIKLNKSNIEGLIVDLRNNGGGSMTEAIRLAGTFIDFGAIAIAEEKGQDPQTLKDFDRGMAYSKPLLVLINEFSASASELYAAAMQDHNRAIIVGSKSFGKATSQIVIPVNAHQFNENQNMFNQESPNGYLKITTGKFFRLDGGSHQKEGIRPDIRLPSPYESIVGEGRLNNALLASKVKKKTYYTPLREFPLDSLKERSRRRLNNNKAFNKIEDSASAIAASFSSISIPMELNAFEKFYQEAFKEEYTNDSTYVNHTYEVEYLNPLLGVNTLTETEKELREITLDEIENDSYIEESYHILIDYIQLTK